MSSDGLSFKGLVEWKSFDPEGNLKEEGTVFNTIQDTLTGAVIDAIDTGAMSDVDSMAIGTGSGQNRAATGLQSYASYEDSTGSHWSESQPSATQFRAIATFTCTAGGGWTITEAGIFLDAGGATGMATYDDSLSVALSQNDTLQITWTITAS